MILQQWLKIFFQHCTVEVNSLASAMLAEKDTKEKQEKEMEELKEKEIKELKEQEIEQEKI